ncbi:MAG: dihydrolipoyl dehydrogenase [Deltaproteobacteria bacterium]|nr:dihydrolipoyl dehydrogenase [Deltaproteobacteria bacterium]
MKKKIVIIGGGPGGYAAALHASLLGAEATLIEHDKIGGTCLNRGCIPSKILNYSAKTLNLIQKAHQLGIDIKQPPSLNIKNLITRKTRIIETQIKGLLNLIKTKKISYIQGKASIKDNKTVRITDKKGKTSDLTYDKLIIASGSKPLQLPPVPFNKNTVISSDEALNISELPETILIIGAGVIGCEFASVFSLFGTKVTIVEALDRVLPIPGIDQNISKILSREMKKRKIKTLLNKTVISAENKNGKIETTIGDFLSDTKKTDKITTDKVLVCIGRAADTKPLQLDNIGIKIDEKGWIVANNRMQTNIENIYAIGDVLGPEKIMLAHCASYEGRVAAENAIGVKSAMHYNTIPSAIFTAPEIGSVGITETEAKEKNIKVLSETILFRTLGKAHVIGEIEGEAKIIFDADNQKILGVHIIGAHATDLIAEGALAVKNQITVKRLAETIHAHPTLSEIMGEVSYKALFEM